MKYSLEKFRIIPHEDIERLAAIGIRTTDNLLAQAATPRNRQSLANRAGLNPQALTAWAGLADLVRIKGVGPAYAELLVGSGCAGNIQQLLRGLHVEKSLNTMCPQQAANSMAARLAEFAGTQPEPARSPSPRELIEIAEEAAELRPRLVLDVQDDREVFRKFLFQDFFESRKALLKIAFTIVGMPVLAILALFIITMVYLQSQLAQVPIRDAVQVLAQNFLYTAYNYMGLSLATVCVLLLIMLTVLIAVHQGLSSFIDYFLRLWLFNTPSYRATYRKIEIPITVQRKFAFCGIAVFGIVILILVILGARGLVNAKSGSPLELITQLYPVVAIGGGLVTLVVSYPTLRFIFKEYRADPDIEPQAIQRYFIYKLAQFVLLPLMVILLIEVALPAARYIYSRVNQEILAPQFQNALMDAREAIRALPSGDSVFEDERTRMLQKLDFVGQEMLLSWINFGEDDEFHLMLSLVRNMVAWIALTAVVALFVLPYLALGGWLSGLFYMLLLAISFSLENILQRVSPGWFSLKNPLGSGVMIAVCIFSSALFFDWLYDAWTEPKKACPGCGRMVEERDFYCPTCGLVQTS